MKKMSAEQEAELICQAKAGSNIAIEALLAQFHRMLWNFAVRRCPPNEEREDFYQIAVIYFIEAIRRFQPGRNARLTTVLYSSVFMQLLKHRRWNSVIRLPCHLHYNSPSRRKFKGDINRVMDGVASLNIQQGEDETGDRQDFIEDWRKPLTADDRDEQEMLWKYIRELPEVRRRVIELRLSGLTLEQVGQHIAVSRARAQQIESEARKQLAKKFGVSSKPKSKAKARPARRRRRVKNAMGNSRNPNDGDRRVA